MLDEIFEGVNNSLPIRCDCLELLYSQIMVLYRRAISLEETSAELEKGTEVQYKVSKGEQPAGSGNGTDVVDDDEDPATDDEA